MQGAKFPALCPNYMQGWNSAFTLERGNCGKLVCYDTIQIDTVQIQVPGLLGEGGGRAAGNGQSMIVLLVRPT